MTIQDIRKRTKELNYKNKEIENSLSSCSKELQGKENNVKIKYVKLSLPTKKVI
jgi:hypothetical protein